MLPPFRGRGVGTELLDRLLGEAPRLCDAVSLSVSETNRARRLYERSGFEPIAGPENGSVVMIKRFALRAKS